VKARTLRKRSNFRKAGFGKVEPRKASLTRQEFGKVLRKAGHQLSRISGRQHFKKLDCTVGLQDGASGKQASEGQDFGMP
jgi:hypothetical protein